MARAGQFKKGGGRHGGGGGRATKRRTRSGSTALVVVPASPARRAGAARRVTTISAHPVRKGKRKGGRRRGASRGGVTLGKIVATGVVLANVAGTNNGYAGDKVYNVVAKLPGAKTFGNAITAGLYLGGIHRFTKIGGRLRPYLAAAGLIGVVGAALKLGEQGTNFKWLGGDESTGDILHVR